MGVTPATIGILLLVTLWQQPAVSGEKIIMLPALIRSHVAIFTALAEELIGRGHEVHVVIRNDFSVGSARLENLPGMHFIPYEKARSGISSEPVDALYRTITQTTLRYKGDFQRVLSNLTAFSQEECHVQLMENEPFIARLAGLSADVVIIDAFFMAKCLYLLPHRLGLPIISIVDTVEPWPIRLPYLSSFVPSNFLPFSDKMTFTERFANAVIRFIMATFPPFKAAPDAVVEEYRKYGHFASVDDLMSGSLLWLHTSHPVLDYPAPIMPSVVDVGGMTTKPAEPLPRDLLDLVQSAESGVIVVSFGSIASSLPRDMSQKFLDAFSRLPSYTFIWRFTNPDQLTIPSNVLAMSWIPQNDLLGRPEVKLFISHCGKNGLFEAVYHGVPVLGVPMMGDQPFNAKLVETKGYGRQIDIYAFTVNDLVEIIRDCVTDSAYSRHAKRASAAFLDDVQTPQQRAAHAVEHVLKFGATDTRSSAVDLTWYQYWMLDIMGSLVVTIVIAVVITWKLLGCCLRRCCKRSDKVKTS